MQAPQYDLRCPAAKGKSNYIYIYSITCITHAAAAPSNLDAAITMHLDAFCSVTWLTRMYLRTWQHQMTTIMQPFQCDLQPQVQETYRTTHTKTTTRCRTQRRNQFADETTPAATTAHRRYLFHRRLQPLYTEKHKVSCSSLLPKRKPMQHSCGHYNNNQATTGSKNV